MVLTTEQRLELLARARAAKANKKLAEAPVVKVEPPVEEPPPPKVKKSRKKQEIVLPEPVILIEDEPEPEPIPEPVVVAKAKKSLPVKWLKKPADTVKVCCEEKLTKEKPVINDDLPNVDKHIVMPSPKDIKKLRAPRASSRTLEIVAEPKAIDEIFDDVKNNDLKYRAVKKSEAPVPSAPIQIRRMDEPLRLFSY